MRRHPNSNATASPTPPRIASCSAAAARPSANGPEAANPVRWTIRKITSSGRSSADPNRVGPVGLVAVARCCLSREAVRYAGLDITVHQSDTRRAPGHLSRQGPSALRWALFEAAQCARRPGSPDHEYYRQAAARLGGNRARLAVARKLLKRSFHTLRELGEEALAPA
jgi:hypothetical protein